MLEEKGCENDERVVVGGGGGMGKHMVIGTPITCKCFF